MLLIVGDPRADWVEGLRRALSQGLDPHVKVEVSSQSGPKELQASLDRLGGDATLTLAAVEFPHSPSHARVKLRAAHSLQWLTRELSFQPGDAETERGRALGFLLSSMVPELRAPPSPPPTAPRPRSVAAAKSEPRAAPAQVESAPPPEEVPLKTAPADQPEVAPPPPAPEPAAQAAAPPEPQPAPADAKLEQTVGPPPAAASRWSLELAGQGLWGAGRSSPDGGATLAAQLRLGLFGLRVGGAFAVGSLAAAEATALSGGPFAGASLFAYENERLSISARLDLAAVYFSISRNDGSHGRWQFTLKPRVDAGVRIAGPFAVFLAVGADIGLSPTRVYVDGGEVADLPPVAGAAELGFRLSF
jgi:hypothetical protein